MTARLETFSARELVSQIVSSDEYLKQPRDSSTVRALASAALEQTPYEPEGTESVHYSNDDLKRILFGLLPDAYESQSALDDRREMMHPAERGKHLRQVVEYNHFLRELVDNNPRATMHDIMQFIDESSIILFDNPDQIKGAREQTRAKLDGMRHEVFAEAMLWQVPGVVDVRQATPEEDMRGIDLVIEHADGQIEYLDIKSTERAAIAKNNRHRDTSALWTGMNWEDFGSSLRIPQEQLTRYLPRFMTQYNKLHKRSVSLSS